MGRSQFQAEHHGEKLLVLDADDAVHVRVVLTERRRQRLGNRWRFQQGQMSEMSATNSVAENKDSSASMCICVSDLPD